MDHLRSLLGELGYRNVVTLIASGNVTFDASTADTGKIERKIEAHLHERLGFEVDTFVRSRTELEAVIAHLAYPPATVKAAHALWIAFLKAPPSPAAAARLVAARCATDDFHVHGREVYWLRRATSTESQFKGSPEKILGMSATARNITTVRKLAAL